MDLVNDPNCPLSYIVFCLSESINTTLSRGLWFVGEGRLEKRTPTPASHPRILASKTLGRLWLVNHVSLFVLRCIIQTARRVILLRPSLSQPHQSSDATAPALDSWFFLIAT